jgi:hypothetical protein
MKASCTGRCALATPHPLVLGPAARRLAPSESGYPLHDYVERSSAAHVSCAQRLQRVACGRKELMYSSGHE